MANFRTQYDIPARYYAVPGERVKTLYGPIFDDKGVMHLTEIGKHDLYGEIQSHAESVDIHVLLARYNNGDVEALSRVQGAYGDFTQMPTSFAEALNTMIAAEQYFLSLPVDVRDRFGQSFNRFLASMDSPDFARNFGIDLPDAASVAAADVIQQQSDSPSSPSQVSSDASSVPPVVSTP